MNLMTLKKARYPNMKLKIRYMRGLWHVMNATNDNTVVNSNSLAGLLDYIYSFGEDYE